MARRHRTDGGWRAGRRPASRSPRRPRAARAVALLEVVLALAIFFGVSVGILGGLSACVQSARDVRLEAEAADLAVTFLSEIQLGIVPLVDAGPTPYEEPLDDWTWQILATPVDNIQTGAQFTRIEVIIRHTAKGYTHRVFHIMPTPTEETTGTSSPASDGTDTGGAP